MATVRAPVTKTHKESKAGILYSTQRECLQPTRSPNVTLYTQRFYSYVFGESTTESFPGPSRSAQHSFYSDDFQMKDLKFHFAQVHHHA